MEKRSFYVGMLLAALAAGGATACAKPRPERGGEAVEPASEAFGKLTVDELAARMDEARAGKLELAIFDNNQQERFAKSHIPGARWVPFDKVKASDLPANKDAVLVFYCANEH